jgi:hypothetical protein
MSGDPADDQLGSRHAGGVEIVARLGRLAGQRLGWEVPVGAHRGDPGTHPDRRAEVGEAEMRPLASGRVEQEVRRLDVAMDQTGLVNRRERLQELVEQDGDVGRGQRAVLREQLVGGASAHERQRVHSAPAGIVAGGQVRVAQARLRPGRRGARLVEHLGGHEAASGAIPRPPYGAGRAGPDGIDEVEP